MIARIPISLEKAVGRAFETLEMFDGLPNSFLALFGFMFDEGMEGFGRGNFEHPDFDIMDMDGTFMALEDLYDIARTDPHAFEAALALPAVKDHTISELKSIADSTNPKTEINTGLLEKAVKEQQALAKRQKAGPSEKPEQTKTDKKLGGREEPDRRERKEKPAEDDGPDDLEELDTAEGDGEDKWARRKQEETPDDDLDDLIMDLITQDQDKDEEPEAKEKGKKAPEEQQEAHAVAWDRIGKQFNVAASERIMRETPDPYQKNVARDAFNRAKDDDHMKRRDNDLPYADKLAAQIAKLQSDMSQNADTALKDMQAANALPL